jgi:hypothetical protein
MAGSKKKKSAPFEGISVPDRIETAKEKTRRVVDHALYLLELHENNEIVSYSPTLASQIPTSYAANAFNVFQQGLHQFEVVRLCALWDGVDPDKENIPTVVELIDCPDVIEALAQEMFAHWSNIGGPSDDPELEAAIQRSHEQYGREQAQAARGGLAKAITDARAIMDSSKLHRVMNRRDKHLAHSLSQTRRERKAPVEQMKYGDERELLNLSLPIVEAFYCWVNGCSFSFEDSRRIDRKNAEALWENCKFTITR